MRHSYLRCNVRRRVKLRMLCVNRQLSFAHTGTRRWYGSTGGRYHGCASSKLPLYMLFVNTLEHALHPISREAEAAADDSTPRVCDVR